MIRRRLSSLLLATAIGAGALATSAPAAAQEMQLIPFRGKLAIFQKVFVDTDAYIHGGLAFVGLQERGDCSTTSKPTCADPDSFKLASRTAIAPSFGLRLSFWTSDFISLALE